MEDSLLAYNRDAMCIIHAKGQAFVALNDDKCFWMTGYFLCSILCTTGLLDADHQTFENGCQPESDEQSKAGGKAPLVLL